MLRKNGVSAVRDIIYPVSDGKPVGETPWHVKNLLYLFGLLDLWFADDAMVFVAADMFVYYEEGNPRRHVSPDLFVVRGIPRQTDPQRECYLFWENKAIDCVIELTSKSTRREDMNIKLPLYRDVLGVKEYFLFDPLDQYLKPRLQGYRRSRGRFVPIKPMDGRLPSKVLDLHLEAEGEWLRLFDPVTQRLVPTYPEQLQAQLEEHRQRHALEQENERLRREIEDLRRQLGQH